MSTYQPRAPVGSNIVPIGLKRRPIGDLYFLLLTSAWWRVLAFFIVLYLALNALFALGYLAIGTGIENARPGSFEDAYFFSIQTMSTIGYGRLVPVSTGANLLVSIEAFLGVFGFAMTTGLMFAKFSRASARVLFSKVAVVSVHDGVPSLMFRMANERRNNQILEAQLRVSMVRNETTREGEPIRRVVDLALRRDRIGIFALTWLAIHPIVEGSPLFGETPESLQQKGGLIVVSFIGTDVASSQLVHARANYEAREIKWNARFADILEALPDGRTAIHFCRFHDVLPEQTRD